MKVVFMGTPDFAVATVDACKGRTRDRHGGDAAG